MTAVLGELFGHSAAAVIERPMVIHIGNLLLRGIAFQHRIESSDLLGRLHFGPPREAVAGQQRTKHHLDPVVAGQIAHRDDVAENVFEFYGAVVPRDVVDARQNDHDLGFQVDHVAAETGEHLDGRLPADTAVEEPVPFEEIGIDANPAVGDGIAHEDHLDGPVQYGILKFITSVLRPVHRSIGTKRRDGEKSQRQEYDFFHAGHTGFGFSLTKLENAGESAVRIHEEIVQIRAKHS